MKARPRIELDPAQGGLHAAFANLSLPDLPPGPEAAKSDHQAAPQSRRGRVVLRRETAHRGGKAVVVIHDFAPHISLDEIGVLSKKLRAACGCGGTVRDREIELQGEQAAKARTLLEREGFQVAGVR